MLVNKFNSQKVCGYLDTGKYHRVLILFHHGLGDAVMFYSTCFKALRKRYPDIQFFYSTHLGQERLFGNVNPDPNAYDIAFQLGYPCSEWGQTNETKSEKCARVELGLPLPLEEDYKLPQSFKSPFVGVHFNSTCCPNLNMPYDHGKKLWSQIEKMGFIPFDTHMLHSTDHPEYSVVHDYEQCRRLDNIDADIGKLLGALACMRGFAGVPSGNMACALAILPARHILYLSSEFRKDRLTHKQTFEMNIQKPYDAGIVREWLEELKKD